jgi:hypothetical protein
MNEEWRDILGHPNYQASSEGRIRNKTRGNILKPKRSPSSCRVYWKVDLGKSRKDKKENNKKRNQYIHRLVSLAFFNTAGEQVDHKTRDTSINRAEDLEPMTRKENLAKRVFVPGDAFELTEVGDTDFEFSMGDK